MVNIPIHFNALEVRNKARKNCNVTQDNELSDGNFYIMKRWVWKYILYWKKYKSKDRINNYKIVLKIDFDWILISCYNTYRDFFGAVSPYRSPESWCA